MDVVVKDEIVVGDSVLLSYADSAQVLKVQDVDGCQIRLDGKVSSIEGEWCKVLVRLEESRGVFGMQEVCTMLQTRVRDVELTERVHVWSRLNAKTFDRVRSTGTDECDYWVPLSSDE